MSSSRGTAGAVFLPIPHLPPPHKHTPSPCPTKFGQLRESSKGWPSFPPLPHRQELSRGGRPRGTGQDGTSSTDWSRACVFLPAALHWNPVCSEWPSPGTKFRGRGCPFGPEDRRPGSGAKEETRLRHRADLGSRPREPRARRSCSSLALAADGQRGGVPAHLRGRGQQPAQPAAAAPHRPG